MISIRKTIMNETLQDLFDGLNHLCCTNEAFYFSEQDFDEHYIIRSYSYRLASWTDFQLPYADIDWDLALLDST